MANGKTGKQYTLEDFRRYRDGLMPFGEQHDLEKLLMEDPFLAEAFEGFEAMSHNAYSRSVEELQARLQSRLKQEERRFFPLWAYATAASMVVALGTAWLVYFNSQQQRSTSQRESDLAVERAPSKSEEIQVLPRPGQNAQPDEVSGRLSGAVRKPGRVKKSKGYVVPDEGQKEREVEGIPPELPVAAVPQQAPEPGKPAPLAILSDPPTSATKPAQSRVNSGLSSTNDLAKTRNAAAKMSSVLARPEPSGGMRSYQEYLNKSTGSSLIEGEVEVSFIVGADGLISDFRTQGTSALYGEAIRIVREGPAWQAVVQNGVMQPGHVKLILKFKKD